MPSRTQFTILYQAISLKDSRFFIWLPRYEKNETAKVPVKLQEIAYPCGLEKREKRPSCRHPKDNRKGRIWSFKVNKFRLICVKNIDHVTVPGTKKIKKVEESAN